MSWVGSTAWRRRRAPAGRPAVSRVVMAMAGAAVGLACPASLAVSIEHVSAIAESVWPAALSESGTGTEYLLVSSFECFVPGCDYENAVLRYDGTGGGFLGVHIAEIDGPTGVALHPTRETLLVVSRSDNAVYEYDARTGWLLGTFVSPGPEGLNAPQGLLFKPDGNLLVTSTQTEGNLDKFNGILEFDEMTGEFVASFVDGGSVLVDNCDDPRCLRGPNAMVYGPNGHVYVTSGVNHLVLEYDGTTGAYLDYFDSSKLISPIGLVARPDDATRPGNILVTSKYPDLGNPYDDTILEFDRETHEPIPDGDGVFAAGLINPGPLWWHGDGDLLIDERMGQVPPYFSDRISKRDQESGAFVEIFTPEGDTNIHEATAMFQVAFDFASDDPDGDRDVDLVDFAAFQRCFGADPSPSCRESFDDGLTGTILYGDYRVFHRNFTGPARPCTGDAECEDGDPCTINQCIAEQCAYSFAPDGTSCADDLYCNGEETCQDGFCVGISPCLDEYHCIEDTDTCLECIVDGECDDDNPCTDDICVFGVGCDHAFNNDPCEDGDSCTTDDVCIDGACTPGSEVICDDENVCTDDSCDPELGCQFVDNLLPCEDGSVCTLDDYCLQGTCRSGSDLDCNDDNPCTDDTCDPFLGCLNSSNTDPCDDGDPCTTDDTCTYGVCVGIPITCDDEVACTEDACVDGTCVYTPDHGVCDNGLFCDGAEICDPVLDCLPGTPPCTDTVDCTVDTCDEDDDVCIFTPDDSLCDDGQFCNGAETCDLTAGCQPGVEPCPPAECNEETDECL